MENDGEELDFLAAHEARMRRITTLKHSLVGIFETSATHAQWVSLGESEEAMRWKAFPVRPPPPGARAYQGRMRQTTDVPSPAGRPLISARPFPPKVLRPIPPSKAKNSETVVRRSADAKIVDLAESFQLPPNSSVDRI
jgi:hypothetical protein